jgi:hypothetical protein
MGTYGFPSDAFAQQRIQIEQAPAPPVFSRRVPGAVRLTARRAARRSHGLGGAGRDGFAY